MIREGIAKAFCVVAGVCGPQFLIASRIIDPYFFWQEYTEENEIVMFGDYSDPQSDKFLNALIATILTTGTCIGSNAIILPDLAETLAERKQNQKIEMTLKKNPCMAEFGKAKACDRIFIEPEKFKILTTFPYPRLKPDEHEISGKFIERQTETYSENVKIGDKEYQKLCRADYRLVYSPEEEKIKRTLQWNKKVNCDVMPLNEDGMPQNPSIEPA